MNDLRCLLLISLLAACNATSEGARGVVEFTPRDCGRIGCDFDDSIGVGGVLNVQIRGTDGVSTAGVVLASSDEDVLAVTAIADLGGAPAWELEGISAGVARLEAIDADDGVVDFLAVGVEEVSGLSLENVLGDAVGPEIAEGYDEAWQINADAAVSFQVTPTIGEGAPTMGRFLYDVSLDEPIAQGLIEPDPSEGYLYFQVAAGEYAAMVQDDFGHGLDVLFVARPGG
jgi:hypothetical protein